MPLIRRLPKHGFTNIFRKEVAIVNVRDLNRFDAGETIDRKALVEKRLLRAKFQGPIKLLGKGELSKSLTVKLDAISPKAASLVEKAGGKFEKVVKAEPKRGGKLKVAKPKSKKPKVETKPKGEKPKVEAKPKGEKPKAEKAKAKKPKVEKEKGKEPK